MNMHRARVVAALVDVRAYDGARRPVEAARVASGLSWHDFDLAALELAERGAIALFEGDSRFPVVANACARPPHTPAPDDFRSPRPGRRRRLLLGRKQQCSRFCVEQPPPTTYSSLRCMPFPAATARR